MKYDTLMPKNIESYLNGRSFKDLKVGDEIAFPEYNGPTAESLVGLTFCFQQGPDKKMEGAFISFDANTKKHMVSLGGGTQELPLRTLKDEVKSMITFEGSDAYFAEADTEMMLGLCTIGELGVYTRVAVSVSWSFLRCYSLRPAARASSFLILSSSLFHSLQEISGR